ncbi:hypothetical protein [Nocardia sp. NBC_01009]|uniref:hypothetical protein n=1 Tax=Nocardia sp. NBC_01009 TaxID=2975996 RepID=UPI00386B58D1|nr:hypothetical protein OHA42_20775 [Nocardia sp. NBC_01009]
MTVIPSALRELLHDPVFWARYTFAHADGPGADRLGDIQDLLDEEEELEDERDWDDDSALSVEFDVGGGYRVLLSVDTKADFHSLEIAVPDSPDAAELGWDDMAHWHPYALRWRELDLICQAIATLDPQLPHPGAPLALLCRFSAVFEDDDVNQAVAAVDAAYRSLRPQQSDGYWPRGADWLARADFRGQNVAWQLDQAGNLWARQEDDHERDFYSTRVEPVAGTDQFPYARLQALLAAATTAKTSTT